MRTIYPVLLVFAIGIAAFMWGASGFGGLIGPSDPVDSQATDRLNDTAQDLEQTEENGGDNIFDTSNQGSDTFVGSIISGAQAIIGFAVSAVLLPAELQRLGLPRWFALPLGLGAQAIAFIGFLQFITGRRYE